MAYGISKEEYEKNRIFLDAFRKAIARNKASKNPIPTDPPPPALVKMVKGMPNAHILSLGSLHVIAIKDDD